MCAVLDCSPIMNKALLLASVSLAAFSIGVHAEEGILEQQAPIRVPDAHGRYDYLQADLANGRLLAAHPQNGTFEVFDLGSGKLIKSLPLGAVQGSACDTVHNRYYVTLSKERKVVAVDAGTFAVVAEIPLSGPGDGILYDPKTGLVYAGHDDSDEVWLIDTATNKIRAVAKLGGSGPEGAAIDSSGDVYFQNVKEANVVESLDASTGASLKTWPTAPAASPHGLIYDGQSRHLLVAGGNGKFVVLDGSSGKMLASVGMAEHVDQIVFDAGNGRVYCPSGKDGTISVIQLDGDGARLLGAVQVSKGAHTIALDPGTHAVWIAYGDKDASYIQKLVVPRS
jgi:YVTN family beta-propeller protein